MWEGKGREVGTSAPTLKGVCTQLPAPGQTDPLGDQAEVSVQEMGVGKTASFQVFQEEEEEMPKAQEMETEQNCSFGVCQRTRESPLSDTSNGVALGFGRPL